MPPLNRISGGSSSLLCWFEANEGDLPKVRARLENFLNCPTNGFPTNIANFTVSFDRAPENAGFSVERTAAMSRWAQMKAPSVALPKRGQMGVCQVDLIRPAVEDLGGHLGLVSDSVRSRFRYGRDQKHRFYEDHAGASGLQFTHDIEGLSEDSDRQYENLGGKIALIHLDGNGFGSIQRGCDSPESLGDWDQYIQQQRRNGLKSILNAIVGRDEWRNGDKVRLETLLWGGDEMVFVVPAWCGWSFLDAWFSCARKWAFPISQGGETALTHSASIVFCNHKAPIHRIRQLAFDLTDLAKNSARDCNHFAYKVLESFDHIGRDLEEHMSSLTRALGGTAQVLLTADRMPILVRAVHRLKRGGFPKSQLVEIVDEIQRGVDYQERIGRLELSTDARSALNELMVEPSTAPATWFHLVELWDYMPEPSALLGVN